MAVWKILLFTFVLIVGITGSVQNHNITCELACAQSEEDHLATEVEDPTAILTQLQFQDLYTPRNFQTSAQTNTIQLRPIVPIQAFSAFPFQQIIRPTFKVAQIATSSSSSTISEYQDMELLDLFVSNWPDPKKTGFGWGVGPTLVFPTGRVSAAGSHAWEAGPAAAVAYRGIPRLLVGFIFQNPISLGYTNSSATPKSQMQFQPRISYTLGRGWYVKSSDSTWTVNWRHGGSTTIPISLGIGRVWKFTGLEFNPWVSGEWTSYRQNTNITPMYTVRFGLTLLFPDFEL
ncbi:MAG: hypothetical protein WA854_18755 [Candidatus Binataceae bacterium]